MMRIRSFCLAALAALCCAATPAPPPPGAENGLLLTLSVDQNVWKPGDTVWLHATLKNVGERPLVIDTFGDLNVRYPNPLAQDTTSTIWDFPGCVSVDGQRRVSQDQLQRLEPGQSMVKPLTCTVAHNLEGGRQHVWMTYAPLWPNGITKTEEGRLCVVYPALAQITPWEGFARSQGEWIDVVTEDAPTPQPRTELDRYYELAEMAEDLYHVGNLDRAERLATELLADAKRLPRDWNYGNALHHGHRLLGLIALQRGDIERAKQELLSSAETPGSPHLNSFGPDPSLAKALLQAGERGVVLEFLKHCGRFWRDPRVLQWLALVSAGQTPDDW